VYVFGSYARGALIVDDVDTDIEYDARLDPSVEREMLDNLVAGRDWNTPFRKALKPSRALQVMFSRREIVAEPVLVYQRGDRLADARERVDAIAPDPAAGRAERDPVHPALEPVAEDLARRSPIMLSELIGAGLLQIELVDLPDAAEQEIADGAHCREVRMRWRNSASPLARAARAAGCYLEAADVDLGAVALMPKGVLGGAGSAWAVDCRETHLRRLMIYLGNHRITNGLFVLRPDRKRPLRALRMTAPDALRCRPTISTDGCRNGRLRSIASARGANPHSLGAIQSSSHVESAKVLRLQRLMGERLECRNISRNGLHRVLQRHEILDRAAGAIGKERASTSMVRRVSGSSPEEGLQYLQISPVCCPARRHWPPLCLVGGQKARSTRPKVRPEAKPGAVTLAERRRRATEVPPELAGFVRMW
jgi:hypothetical protein